MHRSNFRLQVVMTRRDELNHHSRPNALIYPTGTGTVQHMVYLSAHVADLCRANPITLKEASFKKDVR